MPFQPVNNDPMDRLRTLLALVEMQQKTDLYNRQRADEMSTQALNLAVRGVAPEQIAQFGAQMGVDTTTASGIADQVRLQAERERIMAPQNLAAIAGAGVPTIDAQGRQTITPEQSAQFSSVIGGLQSSVDPRLRAEALNAVGARIAAQQAAQATELGQTRFAAQQQRQSAAYSAGLQRSENMRQEKLARRLGSEEALATAYAFGDERAAGESYNLLAAERGYDEANQIVSRAREMAPAIRLKHEASLATAASAAGGMRREALQARYAAIGITEESGLQPWMLDLEATGQGFISALSTPGNVRWVDGTRQQFGARDMELFGLKQQMAQLSDSMEGAIKSGGLAGMPFGDAMASTFAQVNQVSPNVAKFLTVRGLVVNKIIKLAQEGKISDQDYSRFMAEMPQLSQLQAGNAEAARAKLQATSDFLATLAPATVYEVSAENAKKYAADQRRVMSGTVAGAEGVIADRALEHTFSEGVPDRPSTRDPKLQSSVNSFFGGKYGRE